jgi:thiol-disulfide isomerase/thioredoxin
VIGRVIRAAPKRDTFVTARSYILAMKTTALAAAVLLASSLAFGQSMMKSSTGSGGTGSMMKSGAASGGTGSMTLTNTPTADPAVGAELRAAPSTGHKVLYTDLAAAKALAAKGPTVLFFAADWCPYCQADLKDINANGRKLKDITIVVVDYDKERELERTYGVTVQDTFVQIDGSGARLSAWNSGGVDGILARTQRAG